MRLDPRVFLAGARRRIAAVSLLLFGALFGLATADVVGVTAQSASASNPPPAQAPATAPAALAPGDFFGQPGTGSGPGVAAPPPIFVGGGQPMLTSGGS